MFLSCQDASVASSAYTIQSAPTEINMDPSNDIRNFQGIIGSPHPTRPSYSTMSFSVSRFSAESSGTDCLDSGLSPITQGEASCISPELDGLHSEARENAVMRYKEKKKARLWVSSFSCKFYVLPLFFGSYVDFIFFSSLWNFLQSVGTKINIPWFVTLAVFRKPDLFKNEKKKIKTQLSNKQIQI